MNGYNFTDRVRKVLQMAREEAARLHHEYVGTEHILLGLIREGDGNAVKILRHLDVDLEDLRKVVESGMEPASAMRPPQGTRSPCVRRVTAASSRS